MFQHLNDFSVAKNSNRQAQQLPSPAIVVAKERQVPSLARGWRTPDPSPTNSAAQLPSCKPWFWCSLVEEQEEPPHRHAADGHDWSDAEADADIDTTAADRGRSHSRRSDLAADRNPKTAFCIASRTPSPSPYSFSSQDDGWRVAVCNKAGSFSTASPGSESSLTLSPRCSIDSSDSRTQSMVASFAVPAGGALTDAAAPPPPAPPRPPRLSREELGLPDDCPSVGSLNHPEGCADFCKYAKKAKGCKDGDACVRCHICTCKKHRPEAAQAFGSASGTRRTRHRKH